MECLLLFVGEGVLFSSGAIHVTLILAVITYIVHQNKKTCSGAISVILGGTRTVRISNQMADQVNHNVLL